MRISDWSSDVCSSDLFVPAFTFVATAEVVPLAGATPFFVDVRERDFNLDPASLEAGIAEAERVGLRPRVVIPVDLFGHPADYDGINERSEEHTSELQSLMRISYAVFCLKKKKIKQY